MELIVDTPRTIKSAAELGTPTNFNKYRLEMPLRSNSLHIPKIAYDIWLQKSYGKNGQGPSKPEDFIKIFNNPNTQTYLLCCGLASNPEQLDREGTSFIENFNEALSMVGKAGNSAFIGISCPGFSGSEIVKNGKLTPDDVGVEKYAQLIEQVIFELKLPLGTPVIGHSAGGAAALKYKSMHKGKLDRDLYRPVVALHPAVNTDEAKQFDSIKKLLNVEPLLLIPKIRQEVEGIIVRYLIGKQVFGKLTPAEKAQVDMHVAELTKNRAASLAKLEELFRPLKYGQDTVSRTVAITGSQDRITPRSQVVDGLGNATNIKELETHHDDIFINPQIQKVYIDEIVNGLFSRMHATPLVST